MFSVMYMSKKQKSYRSNESSFVNAYIFVYRKCCNLSPFGFWKPFLPLPTMVLLMIWFDRLKTNLNVFLFAFTLCCPGVVPGS